MVVLDNERYGETGMQPTHTAYGVDLAGVARACGFTSVATVPRGSESPELRRAVHQGPGPVFAAVKVLPESLPLVVPPRDGVHLKERFRAAVPGVTAGA